jgi:hypothetical protein
MVFIIFLYGHFLPFLLLLKIQYSIPFQYTCIIVNLFGLLGLAIKKNFILKRSKNFYIWKEYRFLYCFTTVRLSFRPRYFSSHFSQQLLMAEI